MEDSCSLRFLTGDSTPPLVDDFINAQHEYNNEFSAHINNQSIHRVMDDSQQSATTLWSSDKTATEIASGGFDQQLNTTDDVEFKSVNVGPNMELRNTGQVVCQR